MKNFIMNDDFTSQNPKPFKVFLNELLTCLE